MDKPVISIVTACFNSEDTIKDTIESVLNQTDCVVHIEMFGQNSSMNVVQAANIALYEITKQIM